MAWCQPGTLCDRLEFHLHVLNFRVDGGQPRGNLPLGRYEFPVLRKVGIHIGLCPFRRIEGNRQLRQTFVVIVDNGDGRHAFCERPEIGFQELAVAGIGLVPSSLFEITPECVCATQKLLEMFAKGRFPFPNLGQAGELRFPFSITRLQLR